MNNYIRSLGTAALIGLAACSPKNSVDITETVRLAYEPWVDNIHRVNVTRLQDTNLDGKVDCVKYFFIEHDFARGGTRERSVAFADYSVPQAVESCEGFPQRKAMRMGAEMVLEKTALYSGVRAKYNK